ncbi:hypothetical protein H4R34_001802 [Dimargaris verticillata]|uniref:Nucleotide exchange factor SIL1 n=1 Tax=Dimargaris verticillata TaxID=2761393 RepID=A0A9W8EDG0_9FUNG|nr:hypothetical protein H4R34_001802 [Dimargaris verticillata]
MRVSAVFGTLVLLSAHVAVLGSPATGSRVAPESPDASKVGSALPSFADSSLDEDKLMNNLTEQLSKTAQPSAWLSWFPFKQSPPADKVIAEALVKVYWDRAVKQENPLEYAKAKEDTQMLLSSHPLMALVLQNEIDQVKLILKRIKPALTSGQTYSQTSDTDLPQHTESPIDRMWNLLITDLLVAATFTRAAGNKFQALRGMFHPTKTMAYNKNMLAVAYSAWEISKDNMVAEIVHVLSQLDCTAYSSLEEELQCSRAYENASHYGLVDSVLLVQLGLPNELARAINDIAEERASDQNSKSILVPKSPTLVPGE